MSPGSVSLDVRAYFGGYPRLVTAFAELESEATEAGRDVLKLHAGKNTRPLYFTCNVILSSHFRVLSCRFGSTWDEYDA